MIPGMVYENYDITRKVVRGNKVIISIADIHFGKIDPKVQYEILEEQFLQRIEQLPLVDLIVVAGDLYDRKFMADSNPITYATLFVGRLMEISRTKNASVILLAGTKSHDADQLNVFYHYQNNPFYKAYVIETLNILHIEGMSILCIPELYGVDEKIYESYLYRDYYDMAIMHGTIKGAVYGDNVKESRLFTINDFQYCCGPIVSGHVHTGGCFDSDFYYTGSPIRTSFGEENAKGFLITLYNLDTRKYYMHLETIQSFRYDTINIDDILLSDPQGVIEYINNLKKNNGIDYLRICIGSDYPSEKMELLNQYFRNKQDIKLKVERDKVHDRAMKIQESEIQNKYDYVFDKTLTEYEILAKYINDQEGYEFIDGETLKKIVLEDL